MTDDTRIVVLTGHSGCGKTTVCTNAIVLGQAAGFSVGGILTLPRHAGSATVGLDVEDVSSGAVRPLAETTVETEGPSIGRFRFHSEAVRWGNDILTRAQDHDLLVVDEVGPLELLEGDGWRVAFDVLRTGTYGLALVVVRSSLVERFLGRLCGSTAITISVTADSRDALPRHVVGMLKDLQ